MNIKPNYNRDPSPRDCRFKLIDSLSDLPPEYKELWKSLEVKLRKELRQQQDTLDCDEMDALIRYVAFQDMNIHCIQEELRTIYTGLDAMTDAMTLNN